jgi:hypothetical protein
MGSNIPSKWIDVVMEVLSTCEYKTLSRLLDILVYKNDILTMHSFCNLWILIFVIFFVWSNQVYIIEDINDKSSSTNITTANRNLSPQITVHKNDHDIWGWKSPLSPLDIDFYFDTQSISIINYLCMFQLT